MSSPKKYISSHFYWVILTLMESQVKIHNIFGSCHISLKELTCLLKKGPKYKLTNKMAPYSSTSVNQKVSGSLAFSLAATVKISA